jgi:hypothetical protein
VPGTNDKPSALAAIVRVLRDDGQLGGQVRFDWRDQGLICEIALPLQRPQRAHFLSRQKPQDR